MFDRMWLIRAFEEKVSDLFARGSIGGLLHLGIGQEASAVGACSALTGEDRVFGSHRPHAHALAKGADVERLLAELAGRTTGYCGGKGGSMHVAAPEVGFMTATGVVAGNVPLALGAALAAQTVSLPAVALAFFGDGAGQSGALHESLNIAALWQLPMVFVCENNGYAEFSPLSAHTVVERIANYAQVYSIPAVTVDGNDVLAVHEAVATAAERGRDGGGPTFVECLTYRLRGHYEGDPARYRELTELEDWRSKDPVARFARFLGEEGLLEGDDVASVEASARRRVDEAATAALAAPEAGSAELLTNVYAT
jgi:acetoin:2,6-dichlorophenolindophenol oxidoreductase subunit alpha